MKRIFIFISLLAGLFALCSCGGSGSSSSQDTSIVQIPNGSASASVAFTSSSLQLSQSTSVSATFKKTDGTAASGVSVNFSTTLGTITPSGGIAVTDANGTATVTLSVGTTSGQGQITASATIDNKQVIKTGLFSVSLPPLSLSSISLGLSTLSYGGSTSVSVTVTDTTGVTYTGQEVDVTFSSTQAALGKATITSSVRTVNGVATVTYQATTATGSDTITAAISGNSKTVTITINPLAASAITFVSASPANIGLKGMGGTGILETSKVTFKVLDVLGQPSANQQVDFTLNTTIGGLALTAYSGSTAADGTVSTIVQSGNFATSVRVTAFLRGVSPVIATQSDQLVVSTGVPAQDGFSISIETLNPEAWDTDGITDKVTARLSDHFHNPVPDGTAVYFTTSGGSIQPSCSTLGGACTVTWTSQNPRPFLATGAKEDGRAVILAYAVGEEAFVDTNGNGVADPGEFTDTTGAFRDDNENGTLDANEPYIPFNQTGVFDLRDSRFNGVFQNATDLAANTPKSKHVFNNTAIVMSSTVPGTVSFFPTTVALSPVIGNNVITSINLTVTDINGHAMPAGTKIEVLDNTFGQLSVTSSSSTFVVPNTTKTGQGVTAFVVPVTCLSSTAGSSPLTVRITAPSGFITLRNITIFFN